jgi:hypothetical protein
MAILSTSQHVPGAVAPIAPPLQRSQPMSVFLWASGPLSQNTLPKMAGNDSRAREGFGGATHAYGIRINREGILGAGQTHS